VKFTGRNEESKQRQKGKGKKRIGVAFVVCTNQPQKDRYLRSIGI
jgi:hypothetical protein